MEKLASKERILRSAVYLFARHGFAGTGLRELAARAEVNLAMINYFFGSKKGLLKEILDVFFEEYLAIARKELPGTDSLHTKLSRFIYSAVRYFESEQDVLLVMITELPHDDPEIIEYKANWASKMAKIIEKEVCKPLAKETGRTIPASCLGPMLTSLMASRFLFSPLMERLSGDVENSVNIESYIEIITTLFLQGLTAQE
ncbi:MAG: TetR/AcrR family transcriptional regulator [Thermodesulfobacteriota bacterium]|nr:TetR/AcrR family transcriptional regulator [Thermodesulfobacteriota bacterium]